MHYRIIIGNIISFVGLLAGLRSSYSKTAEKTLFYNSVQSILGATCSLVLGAWSGILLEFLCVPRNYLTNHGRLTKKWKVLLSIFITVSITYLTIEKTKLQGSFAWVELIPLLPAVVYLWLVDEYEDMGLKILTLATAPFWVLYFILTKNYVSVTSEAVNAILTSNCFHYLERKSLLLKIPLPDSTGVNLLTLQLLRTFADAVKYD